VAAGGRLCAMSQCHVWCQLSVETDSGTSCSSVCVIQFLY